MWTAKPKKPPPDLPEVQDWCCMRSDPKMIGVLLRYSLETQWADVAWGSEPPGPRIVHRYELRRMEQQTPLTSSEMPTR